MSVFAFVQRMVWESWSVLAESAPYLLFGFLVAGAVHAFVSPGVVAAHLGKGRVTSVLKAALFGIPLPLCSCGVLPAALDLRKKGANRGAVLSFLVSTPETGIDSIALSWVLLGPVMTLVRPLAAFATAVTAGLLENFSAGASPQAPVLSSCGCSGEAPQGSSVRERLRSGLAYGFRDLLGDLAPWLAVGFLLAGLLTAALPDGFLARHLSPGPFSYVIMLAVGVPLYMCATASTPVAAALLAKGLSPGAALVFLLAGPATNAASLSALAGVLGLQTTLRYLGSIVLVSTAAGALLDVLWSGTSFAGTLVHAPAELFSPAVETGCALLLVGLAVGRYLPRTRTEAPSCSGAT